MAYKRLKPDYDAAVCAYVSGASLKDLAAQYGVKPQTLWEILRRRGVEHRRPMRKEAIEQLDMDPEHALVAALLRLAVRDARSTARYSVQDEQRRLDAQLWLRNRSVVIWWLDLCGLPEEMYETLLRDAGLETEE